MRSKYRTKLIPEKKITMQTQHWTYQSIIDTILNIDISTFFNMSN